jgi:alpha,alpha-trehalose phosphorylase
MYGIGAYHLGDILGDAYFKEVLYLDFKDEKKHTKHGLHLANTGGAYLMFTKGLLGIHTIGGLFIHPFKSDIYQDISYRFTYQGVDVYMKLNTKTLSIEVSKPLEMTLWNKKIHVEKRFETERIQ